MTFSKQLFPLLFLFLFPLRDASNLKKCSSSFSNPLRCGPLEVPIRFPFCDHAGFNLHCNNLNETVLELPFSGTFLVQIIDYIGRRILIKDPENCLFKRLLTFNLSGSPFPPPYFTYNNYTYLTCPKGVVLPWHPSIPCLSNSTSSFFVTSNYTLARSMLPLCQIVQRSLDSWRVSELDFLSYAKHQSLLLEWDSPDCSRCEMENLRCGFKRKYSLDVKCFGAKKKGGLSSGVIALISFSIIGYFGCSIYMKISIYKFNQRSESQRVQNEATVDATVTQQPRETMVRTGLEQSTIDSYKKVELGESRRLPGTNDIVCPICLSEYSSKDTVRCIPECDHCFHVECIDPWLKIHGSCPLCRNLRA